METIPVLRTISISREFLKDPIVVLERLRNTYGDRIHFSWPLKTVLLFHPNDITSVLLTHASNVSKGAQTKEFRSIVGDSVFTTEGKDWQNKRKAIAPFFTSSKIVQYISDNHSLIDEELDSWPTEDPVDLRKLLLNLKFRMSSKIFLGGMAESSAVEFEKTLSYNESVLFKRFTNPFTLPMSVPTPVHRKFHRGQQRINAEIDEIIAQRKSSAIQSSDLIGRMLEAGTFTDIDIRNELLTLFVAGFETTLTMLSWSLHLLSLHPEWVKILRDDDFDGKITENFAKESLRLYPPSPLLSRTVMKTISKSDLKILEGTNIVISQYAVQRDARFWEKPTEFNPDRFNEDVHSGSYLPFSLGPRQCVGQQLAISEFKIILKKIYSRFDLDIEKKTRPPKLGALLEMCDPLVARITSRKNIR